MTILSTISVPAGTTMGVAQSLALLPDQAQLTGFNTLNLSLLSLLSNGTVSASALFSTVTTGAYGGN